MENDDDVTVIVCCRSTDVLSPIEGSAAENCEKCNEKVWISPSSQKRKIELAAKVMCQYCVVAQIAIDPNPTFLEPSAEQKAELLRTFLNTPGEEHEADRGPQT